jgi:Ser/Thr protein kinase RdoA (MazF antagonist)
MLDLTVGEDEARQVLAHWDVGELLGFPGERGGTANPAVVLDTAAGRFFLKRRNPRYSAPETLRHDHALMEHLAAKGLCTPLAIRSRDGHRWVEPEGAVYELYPYMPGEPHDPASEAQVRDAGRALACFHRAAEDFAPPPGKEWPRYHAPSLTIEALRWALDEPAGRAAGPAQEQLRRLLSVAEELAESLTDADYAACPHITVHGDWHPANVKYRWDRVCGIFDLDWATRQPRLVDLADGVAFFAGTRASPVDGADIRSVTQPFRLTPERTRCFLEGYRCIAPIETDELRLLPQFLLARWLWCRADPMRRKIPREEAIDYLLDAVWGPIEQLRQTDVSHITLA